MRLPYPCPDPARSLAIDWSSLDAPWIAEMAACPQDPELAVIPRVQDQAGADADRVHEAEGHAVDLWVGLRSRHDPTPPEEIQEVLARLASAFGGDALVDPVDAGRAFAGRILNGSPFAPLASDLAAWHTRRWSDGSAWSEGDDDKWAGEVLEAMKRRLSGGGPEATIREVYDRTWAAALDGAPRAPQVFRVLDPEIHEAWSEAAVVEAETAEAAARAPAQVWESLDEDARGGWESTARVYVRDAAGAVQAFELSAVLKTAHELEPVEDPAVWWPETPEA